MTLFDSVLTYLATVDSDLLICFLVGLVFILVGELIKRQYAHFQQHGIPAQGIILDFRGTGDNRRCVVRFVTQDLRWITEESSDLNYAQGEEVPVLYNPSNPSDFIIGSPHETKPFFLFTVVGLLLIAYVVYMLLR
ncbi:DUF3592 domain-containing protein [Hymenobacter sp. BT635]|uniref:DUF3592 domain-containing protein n=1 Tax=Hymenobacter nitidus TaxID=2880929 RepID=A0ABS8AA38_9BACT|nr:DUF3592 domain-containing protein [Hymenobacter nitidus]MCB2377267.1 DUF3592 domain-containing protein [Hymenobacter nitidus]